MTSSSNVLRDDLGLTWKVVLLAPLLIVIPILLQHLNLPIIGNTYGPRHVVLELFGFVVALVVVIYAFMQLRARDRTQLNEVIPILAFAFFSLYFVVQITEYHPKSTDWEGYEKVGRDLLAGRNPYAHEGFIYPPLFAKAIAAVFRVVAFGSSILGMPDDEEFVWIGVFYVYQCAQFFLVVIAYALSFYFVRSMGWNAERTSILLIAIFILNVPLIRTLRHHQVNLWVLDLILLAIIFLNRLGWISGIALAICAQIKLYPATILLPLMLMKRFRVIAAFILATIGLLLIETRGAQDFTSWQNFFGSIASYSQGTLFRDNSTHSAVFNSLRFAGGITLASSETIETIANLLVWIFRFAAVAYFVIRFSQRERTLSRSDERTIADALDGLALGFLISPLVWEHHYILVLPLALWAVAMFGSEKPWQIGIALFMMFAIPVFDVFPFSYHRLAGLILLLHLTRSLPVTSLDDGRI